MLYVNPLESLAQQGVTLNKAQREQMAFRELEQVFIYQLLQEMRKTLPEDTLLGEGPMKDLYGEFMDDAVAKEWAMSGQLGLASQMSSQLHVSQLQETLAEQAKSSQKAITA